MCGIIGLVFSNTNTHVAQSLVDGLTLLQHRGQDAAGIITTSHHRINMRKDNGSVADVFNQQNIVNLKGNIGIGHVRYPTAGGSCSAEAQPFYTNYPFGLALAHNGNLTNTPELLEKMRAGHRHINTDSDSEVLLNVFADELQRRQLVKITPDDIFDALRIVMRKCKGGYAVILLINGVGMLGFRDPYGIRPLCFGIRKSATTNGFDHVIASESVAVEALNPPFRLDRDVAPGEAIFVSTKGEFVSHLVAPSAMITPCLFEYVYFARPDSILDGVHVCDARANMGEKLAKKIQLLSLADDIDAVIPIPETSRTAALKCAIMLNKPYREGFVKNRYIARTFIMPGQEMRKKTVRLKLNTIRSEFEGKCVLLVDDSIVRGTTSIELIQMARDAGAKKVYFSSAAPPVRFSNVYGIDIPTRHELVAHNRSENEIEHEIGADQVIYNDLEDCIDAVRSLNPSKLFRFEDSCFSGDYVTEEVTEEYLRNLENSRGHGRTRSTSPQVFTSTPESPLTENSNNNTPKHAIFSEANEESPFKMAMRHNMEAEMKKSSIFDDAVDHTHPENNTHHHYHHPHKKGDHPHQQHQQTNEKTGGDNNNNENNDINSSNNNHNSTPSKNHGSCEMIHNH
jgi:amidophosphoribosyltransferase